jgi:hypothetical protein
MADPLLAGLALGLLSARTSDLPTVRGLSVQRSSAAGAVMESVLTGDLAAAGRVRH